jgi:SAM-dependent methyltransferase
VSIPPFDPERQSVPAMREPVPCGADADPAAGRAACQMGWYHYVAGRTGPGETLLDVGAGTCRGLLDLQASGIDATGIENDERLRGSHPRLLIGDIADIASGSFDHVTCFDVIEHVVDDLAFLKQLLRIACRRLYVTTPNLTRNGAENEAHARELTIAQFLRHYRPHELHVASPDGWLHHTVLTKRYLGTDAPPGSAFRIVRGGLAGSILGYGQVPDDLCFADTTEDGHEWGHLMGVWKLA